MSAETEKLFQDLIKKLRPLFKKNGFRHSSQNFVLQSPECWVIINFQKSQWSSQDETSFYVNVGATPKRWLEFCDMPADKAPVHCACDWRWRAEKFKPHKSAQQWTLRNENDARDVLAYFDDLFRQFVIPATLTMTSEAELFKHSGGFEYPQLKVRSAHPGRNESSGSVTANSCHAHREVREWFR